MPLIVRNNSRRALLDIAPQRGRRCFNSAIELQRGIDACDFHFLVLSITWGCGSGGN